MEFSQIIDQVSEAMITNNRAQLNVIESMARCQNFSPKELDALGSLVDAALCLVQDSIDLNS